MFYFRPLGRSGGQKKQQKVQIVKSADGTIQVHIF